MKTVKVYQIGLGEFGRYGFEKLVEMHNHLDEVNLELKGLAEKDFEKLERAEKFARANDIELETFRRSEDLYQHAAREEGKVLVYDAGPSENHAENIYESIDHGFFHLAEKPPSMTREEHLKEKRLAKDRDVFWKVDFIERESPVVKKALKLVQDVEIEEIEVFRQSSVGVQKIIRPVHRAGVKGGDILDKMCHDVYVLDFIEASGGNMELELEDVDAKSFMPKNVVSDRLMTIHGGITRDLDDEVATGQTKAEFSSGSIDVRLHSSWLGASKRAEEIDERFQEKFDHELIDDDYSRAGDNVFLNQEARFFIIHGERNLVGDMLHGRLFDLDTQEKVKVPDLLHDQLYRVIQQAVLKAAGHDVDTMTDKEIDVFMSAIFDVREAALESAEDYTEVLEQGKKRLKHLMVQENGNVLEDKSSDQITG